MSEKVPYNILVTDHTKIEWFASRFIQACHTQSGTIQSGKAVKWKTPPNWAAQDYDSINLNFWRYELENQWLNLYSFPSSIGRDFLLADLDLDFDAVLLIIDLDKQFWDSQINREQNDDVVHDQPTKRTALMIRDPHIKHRCTTEEIDAIFAHRISAFGDPRRIWGVELVNQIKGVKLILAIKSSLDCVPASYIKKYLYLDPPIDILEHSVDPDVWSGLSQSFSDEIIRDTLSRLGQKVYRP